MKYLKLKSEKLFAVVNPEYERVSLWFHTKQEADNTCSNFNQHVYGGHFVVEFNVVPAIYAEAYIDGNYA